MSKSQAALMPQGPKSLADALEEAQIRIAELMLHPDDLTTRLNHLKSKFSQEKASVDAILKASVQQQLGDIQTGLMLLGNASEVISKTKANLGTIDQICLDAKAVITNYPKIKRVRFLMSVDN